MGEVTRNWRSIPISEIFSTEKKTEDESLLPVRQQIENFESKARLNFNKQRPAPPPPGTQIQLPKIGNYQPKILLSSKSVKSKVEPTSPKSEPKQESNFENPPVNRQNSNNDSSSYIETSEKSQLLERPVSDIQIEEKSPSYKKYMIIGDKDTPITIHSSDDIESPNKNSDDYFPRFGSDNPVFESENTEPFEAPRIPVDSDSVLEGKTVKNPLFSETDRDDDTHNEFGQISEFDSIEQIDNDVEISPRRSTKKRAAPQPPLTPQVEVMEEEENGDEYPYIPAPDYDHEDNAMEVEDYPQRRSNHYVKRSHSTHSNNRTSIYRDFEEEGDDFSKYLKDDDEYLTDHTYTWRKNIRFRQKQGQQKARPSSMPNGKHKQSDKDKKAGQLKPIGKQKHDHKQENSVRRSTIRDFSFSDSKIGLGDRSVRSTSAKGRYVKRNKERSRLEEAEGSYEEFLRLRQLGNGDVSNSENDYDTSEEFLQSQIFARSQPKAMKEAKGSLWQRLTWKFRRTNNVYQMG